MSSSPSIGLGILSWRARKTLRASLQSHRDAGLFGLFDEVVIFFNEIEEEDRALAAEFGLRAEGASENLGIMGGMKRIAELLNTDYVLHLENDFPTIAGREEIQRQLAAAVANMESGAAKCYQLDECKRREAQAGGGLLLKRYLRYHPSTTFNSPDAPLKKLRRLFRPIRAKQTAWAAAYIGEAEQFPDLIHPIPYDHWALDTSTANWSNQAPLYPRQWFLQEIIPYAEANPSSRTVNGKQDLEKELNRRWWRQKNWRVGTPPKGLFDHFRLDRPPGDEKTALGG